MSPAPYKRTLSYPKPMRNLNFYNSCISQPFSRCSTCFSPSFPSKPINYVNVLDFSRFGGMPWPLVPGVKPPNRWFADIRYTISTPLPHKYPSVVNDVLRSSRVTSMVSEIAAKEGLKIGYIQKRAVKFVNEMKASISKFICKTVAYILFKVFRRLMTHVLVCPAQMEQLKQAENTGIPIVYLPLHRSHLDYLLITWTMWHFGLRLPHIASGDNLNLSGFGWLLRGTGAFFIRRRTGDDKNNGCGDILYRSVLNSYMTELLGKGLSIEFFLEGTRSRFGKALHPKNGLISNIIEAVQQGMIPDVFLVPASVTYEQIAEGIFFEELMGMPKQRESVWGVFKNVIQSFGYSHCGAVRLHFGAPVRLTEFIKSLEAAMNNSEGKFGLRLNGLNDSYRELLPCHRNKSHDSTLIHAVGYHIVYDAQTQCSISVGSVLTTLLLCKYRDGEKIEKIGLDLNWLCDLLVFKNFDVLGWTKGETDGTNVLQKVIPYLGGSVCVSNDCIIPSKRRVDVLRLAYLKNALIPAFSITSATSFAILSCRENIKSHESLIEITLMICDLLHFDIIFSKPCENLRSKIEKEIMELGPGHFRLIEFQKNDHIDSDNSNNFKISSKEAENTLKFYAAFLRPFVQSLFLVLKHLISLQEPFNGKVMDFVRSVLSVCKSDVSTPFTLYLESVNSDSFSSSMKLLRAKGYLLEDSSSIGLNDIQFAKDFYSTISDLLCSTE